MQVLFAVTLFASATLLFLIQPMFAKMVLPKLGGTPAVWNTCMVFYQATLLAGYVYAHLSIKYLGPRRQAIIHAPLMLLPWLVLPIGVAAGWTPPSDVNPIPWLLMLLAVSVGLPFLFVSASAPMLQAWFAGTGHRSARDPYWLYAASNLGSMLGLLGYPLLVEPRLTLHQQAWTWTAGYGALMGLTLLCAFVLWRSKPSHMLPAEAGETVAPQRARLPDAADQAPPSWPERTWWLALSFAPSSLLLGVTTYMSTDLAAVPLLWVIPLALYLLTFVLVFARWKLLPHRLMLWVQPPLVVVVAAAFYMVSPMSGGLLTLVFPLHLLAFFATTMVCHGELAARRPASRHLTEFYLWMSLGGVLGGMFNTLLAPLVFNAVYEYPMMIAVACLLRPQPKEGAQRGMTWAWDFGVPALITTLYGWMAMDLNKKDWLWDMFAKLLERLPAVAERVSASALEATFFLGLAGLSVQLLARRPVRFGLGVFGLLAVSLLYAGEQRQTLYAVRSFFGVIRVNEVHVCGLKSHQLMHGSTEHGTQCWEWPERTEPWTYYHRAGPVGSIFEALFGPQEPREVGVVGLGTGTIAAYGKPGRRITFFEIDPAVEAIATNPKLFTYISDCRDRGGEVRIVLGDARLKLDEAEDAKFDLLLIDAFSSDAIPVHLLTKEAIQLYFERLNEHGVLAVHISNRHFNLKPVLGNLAQYAGDKPYEAFVCDDDDVYEEDVGKDRSTWVVLVRDSNDVATLLFDGRWKELPPSPEQRLWTDDYSNVLDVLDFRWDEDLDWMLPWTWFKGQAAEEAEEAELAAPAEEKPDTE